MQRGKARGAEEFEPVRSSTEALDAIGVAQRVVDELLGIGRVEFTVAVITATDGCSQRVANAPCGVGWSRRSTGRVE